MRRAKKIQKMAYVMEKLMDIDFERTKAIKYVREAYSPWGRISSKNTQLEGCLEDYETGDISKEDAIKKVNKLFPEPSEEDKQFIERLEPINFPKSLSTF